MQILWFICHYVNLGAKGILVWEARSNSFNHVSLEDLDQILNWTYLHRHVEKIFHVPVTARVNFILHWIAHCKWNWATYPVLRVSHNTLIDYWPVQAPCCPYYTSVVWSIDNINIITIIIVCSYILGVEISNNAKLLSFTSKFYENALHAMNTLFHLIYCKMQNRNGWGQLYTIDPHVFELWFYMTCWSNEGGGIVHKSCSNFE